MDRDGFQQYLHTRQMDDAAIAASLAIAERYEAFLAETGQAADAASLNAFSIQMIQDQTNTPENYVGLARYGQFTKNMAVYVAVFEFFDGHEAMENLYTRLGAAVGETQRDEVFKDIALPPLGTPSTENPAITAVIMERMNRLIDPAISQRILSNSLRDLRDEWYHDAKETYEACASLDEYLAQKGDDFIKQLEQIKAEGALFFTQEITDEVIDFVQRHPEIRQGVREGNIIYEIKIPYMTKDYLAATDATLKRYYYCHCPWVREALKTNAVNISPQFCQCSIGFHKKSWEMIFGQPLEGEVIESVLQGDPWCKFAIHLPEEVTE